MKTNNAAAIHQLQIYTSLPSFTELWSNRGNSQMRSGMTEGTVGSESQPGARESIEVLLSLKIRVATSGGVDDLLPDKKRWSRLTRAFVLIVGTPSRAGSMISVAGLDGAPV